MFGRKQAPQKIACYWQGRFLHLVLIIILGVLAYSNTFNVPFYFDDATYIHDNPAVRDWDYISGKKNIEDISAPYKKNIIAAFNTRIIGFITFWMNYKIGGLNATGFHIVNLLIHLINACLVYLLALITFKRGKMNESRADYVALLTALIFVSHPTATQAVTYISQRFTSLSTMFYISTVITFALWRQSKVKSIYFILSLSFTLLAMKTKEIAFTLPAVIMLYDFLFFDERISTRLKYLWPFLCMFPIIPATLALQSKSSGIEAIFDASRSETILPRSEYFLTQLRVVATYLRLLVLPINQTLDYDYPVYHSFFDANVIFSFLLHALIIGIGIFNLKRNRVVSFGIFWFYITLSVESSFIPIADVIFEHRIYLPSAGLFIAFAGLAAYLYDKKYFRGVFVQLSVLILILLLSATISRNKLWNDEVAFWRDNMRNATNKPRVHLHLANVYVNHGMLEEAVAEYEYVLQHDPQSVNSIMKLGLLYDEFGLYAKALEFHLKAAEVNKNSATSLNNVAMAYTKLKEYGKAEEYFKKAILKNPMHSPAHYNYGALLMTLGDLNGAITEFKTALKNNPDYLPARKSLAYIYYDRGDISNAIVEFEEVVRLDPVDIESRQKLESIKR